MTRNLPVPKRCCAMVALIGMACCAQLAVERHLAATDRLPPVGLALPLEKFPLELPGWTGRDTEIKDPAWKYADSHLNRVYLSKSRGQAISLWMAYSLAEQDRNHNPEVCMPAHGKYEDRQCRRTLAAGEYAEPIQQFRFLKPRGGQAEWVFYWHYTLVPEIDREQYSPLQLMYLVRHWKSPSLTIEVFAPDIAQGDEDGAREFAAAVDQALQAHLPPHVLRSSERRKIRFFNDGGLQ